MNISQLCARSSRLLFKKHIETYAKCHASSVSSNEERDPTPIFFSPDVQKLLRELTSINLQKVFQHRRDQERLKAPTYKFLTTEEVERAIKDAKNRAVERLQMPPVLMPRKPINSILSKDTVLKGYDTNKYVFTDVTFGMSNKERTVVIRDTDGTLRKASWEERDRINQIYFSLPGRKFKVPSMFEPEYLESLLQQGEYQFILDRACLQFEPDDPNYISIVHKVYEHVDEKRAFNILLSTRHFGPLAFHLAWNHRIDNMLLESIQNERIEDAVRAIQLLHLLHPSLTSASAKYDPQDPTSFVKSYTAVDSSRRNLLELALQSYEETLRQRQVVAQGVQQAHGQ